MAAPIINIEGRYFWQDDKRFVIRGVVYQPRFRGDDLSSDPLSDDRADILEQDIVLFKELGLNAIYVYSVDYSQSHELAMNMLAEAGLYVIIGLSTPRIAIDRLSAYRSYTTILLQHYFRTVDCFSKYSNTLGVFVAQSVINKPELTPAAEVIRAVVRDVKKYLSLRASVDGTRILPVGITNPGTVLRDESLQYFTAGNKDERVDFYAITDYSWVENSSLRGYGWNLMANAFSKVPVPCFLSEYGANVTPRLFNATAMLYSADMTSVLSGGFFYEYYNNSNGYGIVKQGATPIKTPDFETFKTQLHNDDLDNNSRNRLTLNSRARMNQDDPTWVGFFPEVSYQWKAWPNLPPSPMNWDKILEQLRDEDWTAIELEDVDEPGESSSRLE